MSGDTGHPGGPAERDVARIDRLLARLAVAARELDAAALPDEIASQRRFVAQLFDITALLLYRDGRLPPQDPVRRLLAACGAGPARLVPLDWGRAHFVHQFWTREFVDALAVVIAAAAGGLVVEVGAGRGDLARWLGERGPPIVATDDGSLLDGRLRWPRGLPAGVEPLGYAEALARYRPAFVLCSWMPLGEDWTPAFRACPSVRDYLLIGEGPGGCTGTPASFAAPPGWRGAFLPAVSRLGLTRNADRAFSTSVYLFSRDAAAPR